MIRAEGATFDELTAAIERFHQAMRTVSNRVMRKVAGQLGDVRTAATAPPEEPPPPASAVSLETLALIATYWGIEVEDALFPLIVENYLHGAFSLGESATGGGAAAKRDIADVTEAELLRSRTATDYLANAENRLLGHSETMWEHARAELLEGFIEGESIDELRDRLLDVTDLSDAGAEMMARNEVVSASNAGSLSMVDAAGFTGTKTWLHTSDDRVRFTHEHVIPRTVPLGEKFTVGLAQLDYPGDPEGPPAEVFNCRCTLTYDLELPPLPELPTTAAGDVMAELSEWIGVLTLEGRATGDARMFSPDALTWAELPLPLLWQTTTADGHDNAVIVGKITAIARQGPLIVGRGMFDMAGPAGAEAYRMVRDGFLQGISVDADNVTPSDVEYRYGPGTSETGGPVVELTVIHGARIRGATLCAIPAFTEARISVVPNTVPALTPRVEEPVRMVAAGESPEPAPALTAAAYTLVIPDVPPAAWFNEPAAVDMTGALTVTDAGRVYGYLAPAGVAHRSFAHKVTVPMGNVDYDLYMGRETLTEGGERVVTGALTMDCGHASVATVSSTTAMEHYDNACSIVATVRIGENEHGVWVAGAIVPGITASQITRMMACQLSGDWRPHRERKGWREFAGALLVPVPGFAMARSAPSVRLDEGQLVASSVPVQYEQTPPVVCRSATTKMRLMSETVETDLTGCPCTMTPDDPAAAEHIQVIAESIGLDPDSRLKTLKALVNQGSS